MYLPLTLPQTLPRISTRILTPDINPDIYTTCYPGHYPRIPLITPAVKKTPSIRKGDDGKESSEPFAEEAKFFVESRLLQREVKVTLEGVTGNGGFLASVIHPVGNIALFLLKDGYAKIADWSIGNVSTEREKYRGAETAAKQARARVWASYTPSEGTVGVNENFTGVVEEIASVDTLVISTGKGERRVTLASLRPPRAKKEEEVAKTRPTIFDVPYVFEAREFLRYDVANTLYIMSLIPYPPLRYGVANTLYNVTNPLPPGMASLLLHHRFIYSYV